MLRRIRRHATYGNVVASLALFLALGGVSYAAATLPKNSVGNKQLKRNAVTSSKVKNRSLLAKDFKKGQLPRGARGPQGLQGIQGLQGLQGVQGIVQSVASDGGIGTITGAATAYVFAGPTATVTKTSASQKIIVSYSGALGGIAAVNYDVAVCRAASTATAPVSPGANFEVVNTPAGVRTTQTAHTVFSGLPAGSYKVGLCVENTGANPLNLNDFSNGVAIVANG